MLQSLTTIQKEIQDIGSMIEATKQKIQNKKIVLISLNNQLNKILEKQYGLKEKELHISEILRLASFHIPRLRNDETELTENDETELTEKDYAELDKWIRRAKTIDGLKNIVRALTEISKYYPKDIRTNLYALIQKIIIEGPLVKGK